jgi:hypothetical protein
MQLYCSKQRQGNRCVAGHIYGQGSGDYRLKLVYLTPSQYAATHKKGTTPEFFLIYYTIDNIIRCLMNLLLITFLVVSLQKHLFRDWSHGISPSMHEHKTLIDSTMKELVWMHRANC